MTSPMRRFVAAIAVCVLTAATAPRVAAQECGPIQQIPWWPRANLTLGSETMSAADRAAVEAQLAAVEALMRKTPYGTPRGFAVRPSFSYHQLMSRTQLHPYSFDLDTFFRCNKYDEHGYDVALLFNPEPWQWTEQSALLDERGDRLYSERMRAETLFGATATFGHLQEENTEGLFVLFTKGDQSPTLPVTREEYLRAMIFGLEGKDQEKVKAAAATVSKTPYERWMEDAPARKKQHEELFAIVARTDPAQAAKMRADMEKAEQAETDKLKKSEPYERAQLTKNVAGLTAFGDKFRAELAAMSPQERASAAFLRGAEFVSAGTPNAFAIVRTNPAFYRATGSLVEPRAILVRMPNVYKEMRPIQEQLYRQLDWRAIKKMVNP